MYGAWLRFAISLRAPIKKQQEKKKKKEVAIKKENPFNVPGRAWNQNLCAQKWTHF